MAYENGFFATLTCFDIEAPIIPPWWGPFLGQLRPIVDLKAAIKSKISNISTNILLGAAKNTLAPAISDKIPSFTVCRDANLYLHSVFVMPTQHPHLKLHSGKLKYQKHLQNHTWKSHILIIEFLKVFRALQRF